MPRVACRARAATGPIRNRRGWRTAPTAPLLDGHVDRNRRLHGDDRLQFELLRDRGPGRHDASESRCRTRGSAPGTTRPVSYANTTSLARSRAWSLTIARLTWVFAVALLTTEKLGYLVVAEPERHQPHHLALAGGQLLEEVGARSGTLRPRRKLGDQPAREPRRQQSLSSSQAFTARTSSCGAASLSSAGPRRPRAARRRCARPLRRGSAASPWPRTPPRPGS